MTTWTNKERENGGEGWLAGESGVTAGATLFNSLTLFAGQLGESTAWSFETEN